jgi:hypothetical protein
MTLSRVCSSTGTPVPSQELRRRATTLGAAPSFGEPTLRPSSSSINQPPSLPSTPPCCRTPQYRRSSSERPRPRRNVITPPHPPPRRHSTPLGEPRCHPSCPVTCPSRSRHHYAVHAAPTGMGRLGRWARPTVPSLGRKCRPSTVR